MIASREYVKDLIMKILGSEKYIKKKNKYSTDKEILIGEWIDGKPIYRKVIRQQVDNSSATNVLKISDDKIGSIVNVFGGIRVQNATNDYMMPLGWFQNGNANSGYIAWSMSYDSKRGSIIGTIRPGATWWADSNITGTWEVIIEYTKL